MYCTVRLYTFNNVHAFSVKPLLDLLIASFVILSPSPWNNISNGALGFPQVSHVLFFVASSHPGLTRVKSIRFLLFEIKYV